MDIYSQIVVKIISAQEAIIGPVAIEQASRVPNLQLDWDKHEAVITGDNLQTIDSLVNIYQELFGKISKEVSKEAVSSLIGLVPEGKLPEVLK
jgi:hypothetical protein